MDGQGNHSSDKRHFERGYVRVGQAVHITEAGGEPVVQVCAAHCCLYRFNQKHSIDCGGAVIKAGMLGGETTHLAV